MAELNVSSKVSTPHQQIFELEGAHGFHATLSYESPAGRFQPGPALDAAAVALVPFAMARAETLVLDGPVSADLLTNLEDYIDAWSRWRPELFSVVGLRAATETTTSRSTEGAVLSFSGGVDSVYELIAHRKGLLGRRSTPPVLAVLMDGMDFAMGDEEASANATASARPILSEFGVDLEVVRTNWRELPVPLEWSFGAGIASVLHLFAGEAGHGVIAPDFPYGMEILPWGTNPVTNPMLGHHGFTITAGAMAPTRTEKCQVIGEWAVVREHLRVCNADGSGGRNCGRCRKCVRTKLNFLAAGVGEIPALGPLDPDEVRNVEVRIQDLLYLEEIASWPSLPDRIETALGQAIRRERRRVRRKRARLRVSRRVRATPVLREVGALARSVIRRK